MYQRIRDLREDRDLLQKDVAAYLKCTQVIHRWDTKTSFTTHPSGEIQNAGAKCSFTTTYSVCLFLSIKNRPPTKRLTT